MNALKKLISASKSTATGQARGFFTWDNWPYFLAVLAVLLLVGLLVYSFKKRRGAKKAPKTEEPKKKEIPKGLPVSSLVKVWKEFLREIPWDFRRLIMIYQHFVVFGERGAGKSSLIDNYTDWQGHARQFYSSYTASPLLRIYLGSKVLVQEIPATLLKDISKNARLALLKLWKPLFRRKDPTVVIVLNSIALQTDEPVYLKQQAQMIRGKVNLLARIRKKPVKVRLVLTHMDQIDGFLEFSQFLTQNNIPLKLEFSSKEDLKNLTTCLEPYEDHLSRALTSLPADKYLKAIAFMRNTPKLFNDLSAFIKILQSPDPLSPEPEVVNLCLAFQSEKQTPVSNPFATALTAKELKEFNPLFRHRVAAAAIGIAGLIYLSSAFIYEQQLINKRYKEMEVVEASPSAHYDQKMHRLFMDFTYRLGQDPLLTFLPNFFPNINQEINQRCIENIRKFYLFPELEKFSLGKTSGGKARTEPLKEIHSLRQQYVQQIEDAPNKILYLLALIYATNDNELGHLIRQNLTHWSESIGLPRLLISDYVNNNKSSRDIRLNMDNFYYRQKKSIADDPHIWMVYFLKISKFYQQPIMTTAEFEKIQQETGSFLQAIRELERYDLSVKVSDLLAKESSLGININLIARKESQLKQKSVKDFLEFIKSSSIDYPEVTDGLSLNGLHENLKVMLHFKGLVGDSDPLFHFLFAGEEFKFSGVQWNNLLNRSRMTFFLRDFIIRNKKHDGLLFFTAEKEFEDLVINPSNDGRFFFTGHARVDGRFTKDAIEKRVKPVLMELPAFIKELPIPEKEKQYFLNFLDKEVEAYGRRYAESYENYYMDFDIEAKSPGALRYVLNQLTLPSSQFMDILLSVRDNTSFDPAKNEYLESIALRLRKFEFFQRLLEEQKGTFPELDKYKALLEQMQIDIQDQKPVIDDDKEEGFKDFKNRLTPLGRISFAIFRDKPDSYLNLITLWLKSVGISSQWQDVFLAPVYQAYSLGMQEIELGIAKIWADILQTDIHSLYNKFPFDISSNKDVSIWELKQATHPHGHFWKTFNALLTPFCVERGGLWRASTNAIGVPNLPENMLKTVNAVARLSDSLWDNKGDERPLQFMIKPIPLPPAVMNEPIAILSYLHAGGASIFGFNQQPSWKAFQFQWQTASSAAIVSEFATKDTTTRFQNAVKISRTGWSFFRLLQKAEDIVVINQFSELSEDDKLAISALIGSDDKMIGEIHILTWLVDFPEMEKSVLKTMLGPGKKTESRALEIKFAIQNDPWALFKLPR
jgi:hypothetical protein